MEQEIPSHEVPPPGARLILPMILIAAILCVIAALSYFAARARYEGERRMVLKKAATMLREECYPQLKAEEYARAEDTADAVIHLLEQTAGKGPPLDPQLLATAYFFRGDARSRQFSTEKLIEAERDFSTSLQLDAKDVHAFLMRGKIRYRLGRIQEAEEDFTAALAIKPYYGEALKARLRLRRDRGNLEGAREDEERLKQLGISPD